MIDKLYPSLQDAVADISDGASILISGFGEAGSPVELIAALIAAGRVRKIICSYPRSSHSTVFQELYRAGKIELELVPQGTLAERIRAGGAGVPAFYTPTGAGTPLAESKEVRAFEGREHL